MGKLFKILSINVFFLLIGLMIIELLLGGWIRKKNKIDTLNIIKGIKYTYNCDLYTVKPLRIEYTRDNYGLRGGSSFNQPEKINILTIGGSTTDQRYINDRETWQECLEKCYKDDGKNVVISNAGVDGQSTFGHLKNFQYWFPLIPNLKPKYIIFYIGINDFYQIADNSSYDILHEPNYKKFIKDNSILFNFYQTIRNWRKAFVYDLTHEKVAFSELKYINKGIAPKRLYDLFNKNITGFEKRISLLIEYTESLGAEPIFVSQPSMKYKVDSLGNVQGLSKINYIESYPYNGVDYYLLLNKLNDTMYKMCKDKYIYIDLTNAPIWDEKDFYDFFHNTPLGAKKVGLFIYEKIKNI